MQCAALAAAGLSSSQPNWSLPFYNLWETKTSHRYRRLVFVVNFARTGNKPGAGHFSSHQVKLKYPATHRIQSRRSAAIPERPAAVILGSRQASDLFLWKSPISQQEDFITKFLCGFFITTPIIFPFARPQDIKRDSKTPSCLIQQAGSIFPVSAGTYFIQILECAFAPSPYPYLTQADPCYVKRFFVYQLTQLIPLYSLYGYFEKVNMGRRIQFHQIVNRFLRRNSVNTFEHSLKDVEESPSHIFSRDIDDFFAPLQITPAKLILRRRMYSPSVAPTNIRKHSLVMITGTMPIIAACPSQCFAPNSPQHKATTVIKMI